MSTFWPRLNPLQAAVGLACVALACVPAQATPLALNQSPPGAGARQPAPNVILSIDDSGSMGWDVNGCAAPGFEADLYGSVFNDASAQGCLPPANYLQNPNPSRINALKAALLAQFGDPSATPPTLGKIPDGRIRLAWQAMQNNGNAPGAGSLTPGGVNTIKPFAGSHRTDFIDFVKGLRAYNGTPSHAIMQKMFNYVSSAQGLNSPWAYDPGATELPYMACRRAYHIFMTDGAWNNPSGRTAIGNVDGTARTLPDGVAYDPTSAQSQAYADAWGANAGSGQQGTLADWAFKAWATDLQPNIPDKLIPVLKKSGTETWGATVLSEYWNPRNDPATWQHVNQYSIGYGNKATQWTGNPVWDTQGNSNYGGGYASLVRNLVDWQDLYSDNDNSPQFRQSDLWHMALNGRGKYYPATNPAALDAAFADILDNVLYDTAKPLTSIAANTGSLRKGGQIYQAGYDPATWAGKLTARAIDTSGNTNAADTWDAAARLDALSSTNSRLVLSYNGSAGINWSTLDTLPLAQQTPLTQNSAGVIDTHGQKRLDYLRGDRSLEEPNSGGLFRQRGSRLGDIVNSNVAYVGGPASGYGFDNYTGFAATRSARTPMVYVGANDGMLHGFDATSGDEKMAYIPQGIAQGNLRQLTDASYTHRYFVDGTPFVGDAILTVNQTPIWKTLLVGTLGAGGKGYFVLDATDPANFTTANAAALVWLDTTASADNDLGYILSPPVADDFYKGRSRQVVKLNNGRWALVMGNGYNSANEAPVLLVQHLDGDKALRKLSPCTQPIDSVACGFKGGNGLSAPQLIDLNGDGTMDVAYAGDLQGHVWKFDLGATNADHWKASFASQPLYTTKTSASAAQAITAAPLWAAHPKGGIMLVVGTGRNLTTGDLGSASTDTIYGLWDNSSYATGAGGVVVSDGTAINAPNASGPAASLVQQSFTGGSVVDSGVTYDVSSKNPVTYPGKRGWYIALPNGGERVLANPVLFSAQKVLVPSLIPAVGGTTGETCTVSTYAQRDFISVLNLFYGTPSDSPVFLRDTTGTNSRNLSHAETAGEGLRLVNKYGDLSNITACARGRQCAPSVTLISARPQGARANWREIP